MMKMKGVEAVTSTSTSTSTPTSSHTAVANPSSKAVTITETKINETLSKICRWQKIHQKFESNIPFVCVTYAQTLDGMIAVCNNNNNNNKDKNNMEGATKQSSSNLALSCEETFQLTHALRSIHDGILIGGNTLFTDNPRLNNRLWPSPSSSASDDTNDNDSENLDHYYNQPVPIIMDTHLNGVMKMIKSKTTIRSVSSHNKIIICCSEDAYKTYKEEVQSVYPCNTIHLCSCKLNEQSIEMGTNNDDSGSDDDGGDSGSGKNDLVLKGGGLNLQNVLNNLRREHRIKSLMVEGGSSILSSFISQANDIVDCVCVTIVPKLIGGGSGLSALKGCDLLQQQHKQNNGIGLKGLEFDPSKITWSTIGCDCIFLASCVSSE
eukprot:CAMPEP_0203666126 /NCGR_PEP_ID=MMETSP0090-20130426/3213_1 /ASSEMBLY_ACC=CAM_ASM_001088 /TAXON_ID=426623 /ORGANISM="Chaetoceros affinis, Strain CCMP159" /LENGTH=377 /DNA_ID=CAMNT_0050529911 /DNA_START=123 /DNA_END=1256 /DNA_ORIENTATION=+